MDSKKRIIGVYLHEDTIERLERLSYHRNMNRNKMINELIQFGVDCYEQDLEKQQETDKEYNESIKYWKGIEEQCLQSGI